MIAFGMVPDLRIFSKNGAPARPDGDFVLYWMIASRRTSWNFALDRALEWARELDKPLLVLEALRADYPWASDRIHRFVIDGMRDNAGELRESVVAYYPYVEAERGAGRGLLPALAEHACVVVTDEFPCFFLPRMVEAAAKKLAIRLEAVDSNGLLPLAAADRAYLRAFDFRRFLQKELPNHLADVPEPRLESQVPAMALADLPSRITSRWPPATSELLDGRMALGDLPIDHDVAPIGVTGGSRAASRALARFLEERLPAYGEQRNHPDADAASELSGYLHFGHLSSHQILDAVALREQWSPWKLSDPVGGARRGWWNLEPSTESFLDELVTWREVGYGFSFHRSDYDRFESLPAWAQETLHAHADDPRPALYTPEQFERAETHDQIWNAAQNQLRAEGRIHNYLRMLWGKKILHWSSTPEQALEVMIHLNNKYAIDGRNPNSYSGIFWVLGRFDRAWGPEREVFGKVRFMSSANTRRKLRLTGYLERWSTGQLSLG
jgi:deoxyribodipyrimidine photo-lyase